MSHSFQAFARNIWRAQHHARRVEMLECENLKLKNRLHLGRCAQQEVLDHADSRWLAQLPAPTADDPSNEEMMDAFKVATDPNWKVAVEASVKGHRDYKAYRAEFAAYYEALESWYASGATKEARPKFPETVRPSFRP